MMDKDTARKLLPLVNNEDAMDALDSWLKYRIDRLRDDLEDQNTVDIRPIQGGIKELRLLHNDFRTRVLDKAK